MLSWFKKKTVNEGQSYIPGPATNPVPSITYEELITSFTTVTEVLDKNLKTLEPSPEVKEVKYLIELLEENPSLENIIKQRIDEIKKNDPKLIEIFLTTKLDTIPAKLPYYYTYLKNNDPRKERLGTYDIIIITEGTDSTEVNVKHLNNLIQWYNMEVLCYKDTTNSDDKRSACMKDMINRTTLIKKNIDEIISKLKPVDLSITGGSKPTNPLQKTNLRVQINNQTRVVYLNKYKTQYVKYKGEFLPLKKAMRLETTQKK